MLLNSKHNVCKLSDYELALTIGRINEFHGGIPSYKEASAVFQSIGLVPEPLQSFSVQKVAALLNQYGPLIVVQPSSPTLNHARLITGISGDGTLNGTVLYINDPSPPASQVTETLVNLFPNSSILLIFVDVD
jgi:papain like cysteine protease AvrRpt2